MSDSTQSNKIHIQKLPGPPKAGNNDSDALNCRGSLELEARVLIKVEVDGGT